MKRQLFHNHYYISYEYTANNNVIEMNGFLKVTTQ